ncbi:hypothetical protein IAT38_006033 [Cryptococcus sp. DSM 104549]
MPALISSFLGQPNTQPSSYTAQLCYSTTEACASYMCGQQSAEVVYLSNYTKWYCEVTEMNQIDTDWQTASFAGGVCAGTGSLECTKWNGGSKVDNTASGAVREMGGAWSSPARLLVAVMCPSLVAGHLA